MKYFDSHSHLNFPQYNEDRADAIDRMDKEGVGTICVGTGVDTSEEAVHLAQDHENVWAAVGIHPTESVEVDFSKVENLAQNQKVIAIGECGLDYFHKPINEEVQEALFLKHLSLAKKLGLPLIIHCRGAYDELIKILEKEGMTSLDGVMHFFAGSLGQAEKFLSLGMYISFAGPITFTDEYDRVIETVPMGRILIETDAPFAAPSPYRGKRNEPSYVVEVAKKIALIKNVSLEEVATQTLKNATTLFKLKVSI